MVSRSREDLVIKYVHVPTKPRSDASGMIAQALPMAAMFMRNKLLSWSAFFLAVQTYLNQPLNAPAEESSSVQPPLLRILFSLIALGTCYLDVFFPAAGVRPKMA